MSNLFGTGSSLSPSCQITGIVYRHQGPSCFCCAALRMLIRQAQTGKDIACPSCMMEDDRLPKL